jgi:hypothetical protein
MIRKPPPECVHRPAPECLERILVDQVLDAGLELLERAEPR